LVEQVPAPSQVRRSVSTAVVQVEATHSVPPGQLRQAPLPLHLPSSPQVDCAAAAHPLSAVAPSARLAQTPEALQAWQSAHCASGSVPAVTLLQLPALQRLQVPQERLLVAV
jgi:hypothetical protein